MFLKWDMAYCLTLISLFWFRFHPERPGVGPLWRGFAHQGGHLPLSGAALF